MAWINPTDPNLVAGGSGGAGYLLVPLYAITTLSALDSGGIVENHKYPFDCDRLSEMKITRAAVATWVSPFIEIDYSSIVLGTPWSAYRIGMIIETDSCFVQTAPRFIEMAYLAEDNDPPTLLHGIGALYGDGTLSAAAPNNNYLDFTPVQAERVRNTSLLVLNTTAYKFNRFSFYRDVDAVPVGSEYIQTMFHGVLVPLPGSIRLDRNETRQLHSSQINIGGSGREKWLGMANDGAKRTRTLEFLELSTAERDLVLDVFNVLKGGLPCWYMPDLDDNDTWFPCTIRDFPETENAGSFDVSWILEGV